MAELAQRRQESAMRAQTAQQQLAQDATLAQQRMQIDQALQNQRLGLAERSLAHQMEQEQAKLALSRDAFGLQRQGFETTQQDISRQVAAREWLQNELERIASSDLSPEEQRAEQQQVLMRAGADGVSISNVGHLLPGRQQTPVAPEAVSVDLPSGRQMEGVMSATGRFFPAGKERDPEDVRAQMRLDFKRDQLKASRDQLNKMIGNPGVLEEELEAAKTEVTKLEDEFQKLIDGLPTPPATALPPIDEIRRQALAEIAAGRDPDGVARKFRELTGKDL